MGSATIEDLPEPVIEYIFSYLSPYRDLKQCMLVNRTWQKYVYGVVKKIQRDFNNAISSTNVVWSHRIAEPFPTISKRYSHSASCCGDSMFVFGGCTTASTTFNDLWRLDLTTRCWIRPLATGTYPPPKACATLISHEDNLVLFGGWTHTSPFPLHQVWRIFNHLHLYNTNTNRWTQIVTQTNCPAMAGHSATLHGDSMVVFGGIQKQYGHGPQPRLSVFYSSNDLWVLNLKTLDWRKQPASNPPCSRYGHSQVALDDKHLIVVGGCGGPNMLLTDVWLLTMGDNPEEDWVWQEMEVRKPENAAPFLSFHPACRVGDQIVIMNRAQKSKTSPNTLGSLLRAPSRIWVPPRAFENDLMEVHEPARRPVDVEPCVNGKKGVLKRQLERRQQRMALPTSSSDEEDCQTQAVAKKMSVPPHSSSSLNEPSTSGTYATSSSSPLRTNKDGTLPAHEHQQDSNMPPSSSPKEGGEPSNQRPISVRPNARRNRQRQLEGLDRMEQRLRDLRASGHRFQYSMAEGSSKSPSPYLGTAKHPMCLFVIDISSAITEGYVTWREPKEQTLYAPEEIILYSLVLGRGEMIMFGGIQKDLNSRQQEGENVPEIVSNSLHFMSAERFII